MYNRKLGPERYANIPKYNNPTLSREEKKELTWQYDNAYSTKESKCAKCKQSGNYVGRNFRHCNTEKEWIKMEEDVNNGTIDLKDDFHAYPKEGKENLNIKFKNMRKGNPYTS